MAATLAGAQLTEAHRTHQLAMQALFLDELLRYWPLLDPLRLDRTAAGWVDAVLALIAGYRTQSAVISLDYYQRFRAAEIGPRTLDQPAILRSIPANEDTIRASLIATGPAKIKHDTRIGRTPEQAQQAAVTAVTGAATRHVQNGGRDALIAAGDTENRHIKWFRVTAANPCAFCAMLASRGPVYLSRASALYATAGAPSRQPGEKYHDNCHCTVEPQLSRTAEWPGRGREFQRLWKTIQNEPDALNAFRRAYEGSRRTGIPLQTS
ncbi:hypothetical protein [Amycolatopsis sp. NPDC021455]|uniref:VG15 protein n=1 Tax=Amycolatopsis sp. NPDC021455 TaxID=3154901 RepID=UPI0033CDD89F